MNIAQINAGQLRPLPLPARVLARPRLIRRLAEADAQAGRLVLLCAPLGYGKSCLLSQYAHSLSSRWAWLRLTQADNQPLSLLLHLHAALGLGPLDASACDLQEKLLWSAILDHLERSADSFTLILDDLQVLRARRACQYLDQLLRFAPAGLHLLGASEGLPCLALTHLRRDERLWLLDARDLALDSEETRQLASARDIQLNADAIYQLRAGSEGWISGVLFWLAACREQALPVNLHALRPITRKAYAHVAQFLEEELLRQLPPALLGFIECTSVVQAFDTHLARTLSAHTEAGQSIRQLQRADLFIEHCPGETLEYRYHPALRNSLYQRLRQRDPRRLRELHLRAANWLLEHQRYAEAIHQFGRAKDFNAMLATVERHGFDLLREGQVNAIVDFLAEQSGQSGGDHFTLAVTEASTVIVTNDIARSRICLQRLQGLRRQQGVTRHPERIHQTVAFLRSRLAFLGGNLVHGLALASQALQHYPQHNAAGSVLHFNRASCLFALGQLHAAHHEGAQALEELQGFGFSGYTNLLHLLLGQIELAQGQLDVASRRLNGLDNPQSATTSRNFYELFRHLGQGLLLLQQNQLDQARHCLSQAEAVALDFPHCAGLPWVFHHQAGLHAARGEHEQALDRWDEARRLARQYQLFALYRLAGAGRVRLALRVQDQDFIRLWLEEWQGCHRRYGENLHPEEWLAYAWVQRHLGQHDTARQIIARLDEQAEVERNLRLQLELRLLEAALNQDLEHAPAALRSLDRALQLAERHGFGQLLHHEGQELAEPLRQLLLPQTRQQLGLDPLPPRERLAPLLRGLYGEGGASSLIEPLTRREQDVLKRMARGQNNQQIAEALFISLSTVKTHINNLFRKLDVGDRDAALRAARGLRLLE
ncbi:LuxR C-terminal-related transcriptional regulator [Pseudomonas sp. zfem002]|uniref:LuxR C-terminal-related transcriptional regulator n=1 Tax=Pseudomonas sp. zfem002 TaxID=3078197 RepID=UPI0029281E72|nr:LuxR C-terminal-related transcriptional regulator [Pseudomonas sp. zfem002]MDU9394186.1 LuxR C-terminal-related transcriptional regulator [Pseudomonas sp. zfem002]